MIMEGPDPPAPNRSWSGLVGPCSFLIQSKPNVVWFSQELETLNLVWFYLALISKN